MLDDPKALTSANWNDVHIWLTWLWTYIPLVLIFAITILTAHAIIPSLISTGHLPQSANRLRLPLTGFALLLLVGAVVIMVFAINKTLDVEKFWDRYLI